MPNSSLVKIFFFDQGKICVAFHLGERLILVLAVRNKLFCITRIDIILADGSDDLACAAQHTHITLHASRRTQLWQRLSLRKLPRRMPVMLPTFNHVTVVAKVRVISATFVLEGFDGCREINFAFVKLIALQLVQFLGLVG